MCCSNDDDRRRRPTTTTDDDRRPTMTMRGSEESRWDVRRTASGPHSSKGEKLAAVRDYLAYPIKANRAIDAAKNKINT